MRNFKLTPITLARHPRNENEILFGRGKEKELREKGNKRDENDTVNHFLVARGRVIWGGGYLHAY